MVQLQRAPSIKDIHSLPLTGGAQQLSCHLHLVRLWALPPHITSIAHEDKRVRPRKPNLTDPSITSCKECAHPSNQLTAILVFRTITRSQLLGLILASQDARGKACVEELVWLAILRCSIGHLSVDEELCLI